MKDSKKTNTEIILPLMLLISPLIFLPGIRDFSNLPKQALVQVCVSVLWLAIVLKSYRSETFQLPKHPLLMVTGLWLLWCGISVFWATDRLSGLTLWLHWLICGLCFLIVLDHVKTLNQLDRIVLFFVIGANLLSIIGIMQYLGGMDLIPQMAAPAGTFGNRNIAAQLMVFACPLGIMLFLANEDKKKHWLLAVLQTLPLVYLYYLKTRSAWLAVGGSLVLLFTFAVFAKGLKVFRQHLDKRKFAPLILSLVLFIGMAAMPPYERQEEADGTQPTSAGEHIEPVQAVREGVGEKPIDMSLKETFGYMMEFKQGTAAIRMNMWVNSLPIVPGHFPFGVGLGNWYIHYPLYHQAPRRDTVFSLELQPLNLHNTPLQMLVETSVPGFLLYTGIFLVLLRVFFRTWKETEDNGVKMRLMFMMAAVCGFSIGSLFTFPLRSALPPLLLMVLSGLVLALERMSGKEYPLVHVIKGKMRRKVFILVSFALAVGLIIFNYRLIKADYHYLNSMSLNAVKQWEQAGYEAQKAIELVPWQHRFWLEMARANDGLKRYDDAVQAGENGLRYHPNYANTYLRLAYSNLHKGDLGTAEKYDRKALNILPHNDDAHFVMGLIKEKQGNSEEAFTHFRRVIEIDGRFAPAHLKLGIIRFKEKRFKEAEKWFNFALKYDRNVPGASFYLGLIYEEQQLPDKAVEAYNREIKINPGNSGVYVNLGLIHARKKEWSRAVELYKEAIRLKPGSGAAHVNLAFAYLMLKDYPAARKHAQTGKKLGISQAVQVLERLEKEEGTLPD